MNAATPLFAATVLLASASPAQDARAEVVAPVRYKLSYSRPGWVEVTLTLPPGVAARTLVMPRAVPMGYGEVHYDRFVHEVVTVGERLADGSHRPKREPAGPRWPIRGVYRTVKYQVHLRAMEHEVLQASDASKHRPRYVGILGYSVFAYVEGLEDRPIHLRVQSPADWPVFSTLAPAAPPARDVLEVEAADFYALADSQIAMGPDLKVIKVPARVPLFVAVYAEGPIDVKLIGRLAREALDPLVKYFGTAPFPHYTIHQEYLKPLSPRHEYGFSMEHMDSGTFFLTADRALTADSPPAELARTRYNFAHHIAHSWIPKRSCGPGYFPFTWEVAPVIDGIWFSEGWGQYAAIAALAAVRDDGEEYRRNLVARRFRRNLDLSPKFLRAMTLVEVSRIASTRYGIDFRTGMNVFARGGLMAYEIDEAIRAQSGGEKSLRDLLRALVAWSAERGEPLVLDDLPAHCRRATGVDVTAIFDNWMGPVR